MQAYDAGAFVAVVGVTPEMGLADAVHEARYHEITARTRR